MRSWAGLITLFSVLQGTTALYDLPEAPVPRDQQFDDLFNTVQSDVLKRSTHNANFPLNLGITNKVLFSGNFQGGQLTVKCTECRTTGEVVASAMLPDLTDIDITQPGDIFDDSMLGLTFNGVGATIDLDLAAAASGDFSVPLLKTQSPIGIAGPGFQIGVVFSVDLAIELNGEVETKGGFQVAIPDGSSFLIPFDTSKPNVANFDGASASLLPITVDLAADITVALRLKVEAGVMLPDLEFVEAKALAGAFISIPEVVLRGATSFPSKTCVIPVSAELDINAGVFVDIGAEFAGIEIGDFNPTASTTLFAASTSTCLKSAGSASASTSKAAAHTSFRHPASGRPTPRPEPTATAAATTRKASPQGQPSRDAGKGVGGDFGAPSTFAVVARTYTTRSAYPITMQRLATPITNYAVATPAAVVAGRPFRG